MIFIELCDRCLTSCWFDMMKWLEKHKSQAKDNTVVQPTFPYAAFR